MAQIRPGDRTLDPDESVPYRATEGVQVSTTTRGPGSNRTHFVRSRSGELCQLGDEEYFLFTLLDGQPTFAQIQAEFRNRFAGDLSARHFQAFVDELTAAGILERIDPDYGVGGPDEAAADEAAADEAAVATAPAPDAAVRPESPTGPAASLAASPGDPQAQHLPADEAEDAPTIAPRRAGRRVGVGSALLPLAWLTTPVRYYAWLLIPTAAIALLALFLQEERIGTTLAALDWRTAEHWLPRSGLDDLLVGIAAQWHAWVAAIAGFEWSRTGVVLSDSGARLLSWSRAVDPAASADRALAAIGAAWATRDDTLLGPFSAAGAGVVAALLLPRLAAGVSAAYHGAPGTSFRFRPFAYARPGIAADRAALAALGRKGQAWFHGVKLLSRLTLFVTGTFLWLAQPGAEAPLAVFALFLAGAGLWSFLLTVPPLWPASGRRWLAAFLDEPALVARDGSGVDPAARAFQVTAVLLGCLAIVAALLPWFDAGSPDAWYVPGGVLMALTFLSGLLWLHLAWTHVGSLRPVAGMYARRGANGLPSFGRPATEATVVDPVGALSLDERLYAGRRAWPESRAPIVVASIIATLIAIAFLPYPYESGGSFTILPYDRFSLPVRVSGEVTEVLVREGDWVAEGQVIGTLGDWVEVHALNTAQAQLEQALANLQNLLISPKPEEVVVAQRQFEQAQSRIAYSKSEYERDLALVKTNDTSVKSYESALSTYLQDQAAVAVTKANYDLVRVGPTAAQIAAARANVHAATETVSYAKDQLDRTRIRATGAGQVVTADPQLLMGQFLNNGATFVNLENHRVAHLEVQVPENDIRDIHPGSLVRAKAWGYEHTIWLGKTVIIAPDAQPNATLGNIVRVIAEVPNPDGLLRPTMSGDAKVETVYMPVWISFTRAIMRFLLIEVWYWIP